MEISRIRKPGCYTCKAKRVKCDRTVPSCQRCLKACKICPGYQNESDHMFRDMGKYAEAKVQKRVKERLGRDPYPVPEIGGCHDLEVFSPNNSQSGECILSRIPQQVGAHWEDAAIPHFFADYIFRSERRNLSSLAFIKDIASTNTSCTIFNEALRAVALVNLANQTRQAFLALESQRSYYRAVGLMARALQDPRKANTDATLAASFLIGFYNMINGYDIEPRWGSFNLNGTIALLHSRGEDQLKKDFTQSMWGIIYTVHMAKSITSHFQPVDDAEKWVEFAKPYNPTHKLSLVVLQSARRCADAQVLFDEKIQDEWWIIGLLKIVKEVIRIEEQYQEWEDSASGIWGYKQIRSSCVDSQTQHIYYDILTATFWNRNRSFRIHLHEVLLRCISLIQSHPYGQTLTFDFDNTRMQSTSIIKEMISNIRASIPFCFGTIDSAGKVVKNPKPQPIVGYFTLFPLYLAMVSAEDGSETEAWLRGKLEYVSGAMGITLATQLAHRGKKDPWDIR